MRVGGIIESSLSNGEGTRTVIFLSGCLHNCEGCHNEEMQDIHFGEAMSHEQVMEIVKRNMPVITGITLSGGEPFVQASSAAKIAFECKKLGLDVWTYTGFTYDKLANLRHTDSSIALLLANTDVLVDGRFLKSMADENLKYKGSSNQRTIKLIRGELNGVL